MITQANYCVVIPIFNHHQTIGDTVARVSAYSLPVIVVDDGSDQTTKQRLAQLSQQYSDMTLVTLAVNGGKGAAVMAGLQKAAAMGFTHSLQIDADGQHDSADIPRFLAASEAAPNRVISGRPVYDESVPKSRLYGRYITHFWVWLETLSFDLKDTMCGYRVYPLSAVIALLEKVELGRRMDFDIEVLVRLYWQGCEVDFIDTRVIYPDDGLSHFDALWDNVRLSYMHSRLFLGMLARSPRLLARKIAGRNRQQHWSSMAERGSVLGIKFMLGLYNILGRRAFSLMLKPVMGYYYLSAKQARLASTQYIKQLQSFDPGQGKLSSFQHFLSFGECMLDKLSAWSGGVTIDDVDILTPAVRNEILAHRERQQGLLLLGSHLGNIELCRALSDGYQGITVNAVVFTEHAESFNRVMAQINPDSSVNLLPVSNIGPETIIMLKQKIDAGEWVVIVGDRTSTTNEQRVVWQSFLGRPAPFAQGPFILASLLACPVYLIFGLKNNKRYQLSFEAFANPLILPRKERQQALATAVERYADRLENYCRQAPLQWFNFFDFWNLSGRKNDG
ncbi:hypothetical protein SIN8267_01622 [Sinobacterium norvegicum]|uniref:Glycosyltransferase 2-like domain-containing protein n=1 Tax=Sinobacterium norvegicum TaxID=1641715 RepID=A0ABM9AE87_9GAMM|nr:glycosyltransferase family 2 protein [Sinobacterium norvegicum]CAH0991516.1 hypothetical protein SIN8267_01622 [Sinobacterium norvegicum]